MKGTTGHTQPKNVVSDSTFPLWLSLCRILRYILTPPRDVVDQRDLPPDWLRAFCAEEKESRELENQIFHRNAVFAES